MRSIHGLRTWTEVANKNFQKALDFKGHEFKRTEKVKMKSGVFLEELKLRINYLNSRGENKSYDTPFEDRK
jgi:histone deacetylase complex regulatory component SIN3